MQKQFTVLQFYVFTILRFYIFPTGGGDPLPSYIIKAKPSNDDMASLYGFVGSKKPEWNDEVGYGTNIRFAEFFYVRPSDFGVYLSLKF